MVTNQIEMLQFLLNSKSIYHYLCGLLLYNELNNLSITLTYPFYEIHHVLPRHSKQNPYPSKTIEQPFNLIPVSLVIHIILHLIRFL